jgi:hypothetical protein
MEHTNGGATAPDPAARVLELLDSVKPDGDGWFARCPAHPDPSPSLHIDRGRDGQVLLHCFAGCDLGAILAALGLEKRDLFPAGLPARPSGNLRRTQNPPQVARREKPFTPDRARVLWAACLELAQGGELAESVNAYLAGRGLLPDREGEELYGVAPFSWRPHLLAAPLFDVETGKLVNVQMRRIDDAGEPKTMNPKGSRVSGTVFANWRALEILRGERIDPAPIVIGEGLTDFLALSFATTWPVVSLPGVSVEITAPWAKGRTVYLALDQDGPGEAAAARVTSMVTAAGGRPFRLRWPPGAKDACDAMAALGGLEAFSRELGEAIGGAP